MELIKNILNKINENEEQDHPYHNVLNEFGYKLTKFDKSGIQKHRIYERPGVASISTTSKHVGAMLDSKGKEVSLSQTRHHSVNSPHTIEVYGSNPYWTYYSPGNKLGERGNKANKTGDTEKQLKNHLKKIHG